MICVSGSQQYTMRNESKNLKPKNRLNPDRRKMLKLRKLKYFDDFQLGYLV